jgi:hypothetical protein
MDDKPIFFRGKEVKQTVEINGETFRLGFLSAVTHSRSYPFVMVGEEALLKPLISVECYQGVPTEESLERATLALASYRKANGAYSEIPDMGLDYVKREFTIAMVDPVHATIDRYEQFGVSHVVVEARKTDENWYRFAVWDFHLCELLDAIKEQHYNRERKTIAERFNGQAATDVRL